jgi:eukaryotic-like serine/threonine-protein kinase
MIGRQISHYRILEKLGEGGMGVVYKAEDIKLTRTVALKFLRSDTLPSQQDKARFIYEARAASAFEHTNICSIFEIDETEDGQLFICMPFYEGETLRSKIKRGPLQIADAIGIAIQIGDGLQEAHGKGIIHRDIKSGNIIVAPKGQVKIMDFGLATGDRTTRLTSTGVTLGTVAYMSPEQVRGEKLDLRTDIWSTGVVLYEMIAGSLPFSADLDQATMYLIVNQEPKPLTGVRTGVPIELERIASKAMAKLSAERYQSAAELVADLGALQRKLESKELLTPSVPEPTDFRRGLARSASNKTVRNASIALAALVCILAAMWITRGGSLPRAHPIQVTHGAALQNMPAISPDGERIAYVSYESGNPDIYVTDVRGGVPLNLTQSPSAEYGPKWSPDGSSIVFESDRGGERSIWKVGQFGGSPMLLFRNAICPAISADGKKIVFSRVNKKGNLRIGVALLSDMEKVKILTGDGDGPWDHLYPAWSPDGKEICYSAHRNLWLVSSEGGKARQLTTDEKLDEDPVWSPDGRHVYFSSYREETLSLWRVSARGGKAERVTMGAAQEAEPSMSHDGKRLAYSTTESGRKILLRDLGAGKDTSVPGLEGGNMPSVARDKSRIVFVSNRWGGKSDLWIQSIKSHEASVPPPVRLTDQPGNAAHPVISPDGKWIAYCRIFQGRRDIWIVSSDGGQPVKFGADSASTMTPSWSPDNSMLAFVSDRDGGFHVWVAPVREGKCTGSPTQVTTGDIQADGPCWSPDGKRIAFRGVSGDESEIWVVPLDGKTAPRQVTQGAQALRTRWEPSENALLVSGLWGQGQYSLRRVPLVRNGAKEITLNVLLNSGSFNGMFDLSRDGQLLVYCNETLRGSIWVLEAEKGAF